MDMWLSSIIVIFQILQDFFISVICTSIVKTCVKVPRLLAQSQSAYNFERLSVCVSRICLILLIAMGFYYHTWETTKQNVILCGIRLYFLLHINMTRIQTWKKKKKKEWFN